MPASSLSLIQMAQTLHTKNTFVFSLNTQFLDHNFQMIRQCLLRVQDMTTQMGKQRSSKAGYQKQMNQLKQKLIENQKNINLHDNRIKQIENNVGDKFMQKMYQIENKVRNLPDFEQILNKLKNNKTFVLSSDLENHQQKINNLQKQNERIKQQLSRYVETNQFSKYQDYIAKELDSLRRQIEEINKSNSSVQSSISMIKIQSQNSSKQVKQNNNMLKQINFPQIQQKIKRFKQDTDQKVSELSIKLKKKCAQTDLAQLQKNIIEKLDKFFAINQKAKANVNQTKDALIFLQKRLNDIYDMITIKQTEQQNDALFSAKKIQCASCTKDLGKFEGKLGQFKPWAIFPCRQLEPQKTGGYGYVSYLSNMSHRRGNSTEDSNLQRLNRTFFQKSNIQQESPTKKMNSTRTTKIMSSYGEEQKNAVSLKDQYFKDSKIGQKSTTKVFRVKKDSVKQANVIDNNKSP